MFGVNKRSDTELQLEILHARTTFFHALAVSRFDMIVTKIVGLFALLTSIAVADSPKVCCTSLKQDVAVA